MTLTPEQIKIEAYPVVIVEDGEYPLGMREFAILDSEEQTNFIERMLDEGDPEWEAFDERIYYYVETWRGESIEDLMNKDNVYNNLFYIDEEGDY
jgi:hypothetical protein